jgi:hypothetical protein
MNSPPTETIIKQLTINGYAVNKIRKGEQIVYRLADQSLNTSLPIEERQKLAQEISKLHKAEQEATGGNLASSSIKAEAINATLANLKMMQNFQPASASAMSSVGQQVLIPEQIAKLRAKYAD